jgi:hypothetical protein
MTPPQLKVWIGTDNLMRRETASIQMSVSGVTASSNIAIDFVNYGTPVSISLPDASSVASYASFLAAAKSSSL